MHWGMFPMEQKRVPPHLAPAAILGGVAKANLTSVLSGEAPLMSKTKMQGFGLQNAPLFRTKRDVSSSPNVKM